MTEPAPAGAEYLEVWEQIVERLKAALPHSAYATWFRPVKALGFDGSNLTLGVGSRFHREWIEAHYRQPLVDAVGAVLGSDIRIVFQIVGLDQKSIVSVEPPVPLVTTAVSTNGSGPSHAVQERFESNLNNAFTFANYVEGDCNRFARAAAVACSEQPGKTPFNPLMIYGGPGLGKTHLLQAIGNYIMENRTARKVVYTTSEQFTNGFVEALKSGKVDAFSKSHRRVDVLLIDDVQFLMAKEKTQEEFFHTFNALHHAGKQLVFSSDRPPRDLTGFDERLVSRLQWGLVTEITAPEYETRMAILMQRAEQEGIALPEDVAHFLALNVTDNIRSLQGALIHMLAQSSLLGRVISVDLARQVMRNFATHIETTISIERIQQIVADTYDMSSDLLRSKTRRRDIAEARMVAMFLATEYTRHTLKAIGLHFGGRDHATIIHARETINERCKEDKQMMAQIEELRRRIEMASL
ncbi:MAG: chromosomal replication initiator protein DnaA [Calditrichaeota bacterium]|nr:chromosomal replication initiator protein DnaA [Calditrichota bacterium]